MSDIFISYNKDDRLWVQGFAKALESRGWSVWWDRSIPTGESFDLVIKQALTVAKCVVVVWSARSVNSDWVKAEADEAKKRKVLLPVRIEDVELPLGFSRLQTPSLVGWEEGTEHDGFAQLQQDIVRLVGQAPTPEPILLKPWWQRLHPLWYLSLPTIFIALVVIVLMRWTMATVVQLELTTERVEFVVGATQSTEQPIANIVNARSVSIEKFSTLSFEPAGIQIADPSRYDFQKDTIPDSVWNSLALSGSKVTFLAFDARLHPRLMLETWPPEERGGLGLATTAALGTQVVLEARGRPNEKGTTTMTYEGLTIKGIGRGNGTLEVHGSLLLTVDHTHITGVAAFSVQEQQELTYRSILRESMPWIELAGRGDGPIFSPTFSPDEPTTISAKDIPVETIEFVKLDQDGDRVSALTGNGTITFPGYPHLGRVELAKGEAIGITGLTGFVIKQVTLHPKGGGLRLVGEGLAKEVRTKIGPVPIPHRLTAFEVLQHNPALTAFLSIVLWVFPTTIGAYRLWKEFRR